ncbi:MAG: WYL domain-containing protein [Dictyoglomus sp. NZ13-RE01]|nr:MAG: WYL domain-containing protein [Dictyoglomus sp. NZ13-RE01]
MSKRRPLIILYKIFEKIRDENYPSLDRLTKEISHEYGEISKRTIKRYLQTLRDEFNLPLEYSRKHGGYFFREKSNFPFPPLTEGEVLALILSANMFQQFQNTPLEEDFKNLLNKIVSIFPDNTTIDSKNLEMALSVSIHPIKLRVDINDVFKKVFKAIMDKKRIAIKYHSISTGEENLRKVDPYHIYNYEGVWYFCGYCHLRKEMRDFAMDRVKEIKILDERFEIPKDFNIKDYFKNAFRVYKGESERIKIKFDEFQAKWIKERIWHETQKIEDLGNGEVILEITANIDEVKRWVLSYGSHAEVLEPAKLREEIKKEIEKMNENYKS